MSAAPASITSSLNSTPRSIARHGVRLILAGALAMLAALSILPASEASAATCVTAATTGGPTRIVVRTPTQTDCITFTATAGEKLRIRITIPQQALTAPKKVFARIARPNGSEVCAEATGPDVLCTIDTTGTHTINLRSTFTSLFRYDLTVQSLTAPRKCGSVSYWGAPYETPAGKTSINIECVQFDGQAGDVVHLHTRPTSGSQEVVRPDGTTVCAPVRPVADAPNQDSTCTLTTTGRHTIFYVAVDSGSLLFKVRTAVRNLKAPVGCSELSTVGRVRGINFEADGIEPCYTFSGQAGDVIRISQAADEIESTEPDPVEVAHFIVATAGGAIECVRPSEPWRDPEFTCTLTASGTHTLIAEPKRSDLPSRGHRFTLRRIAPRNNCPAIKVGTTPTKGWISRIGEVDCFVVDARAGEVLRTRIAQRKVTTATGRPAVEVIGPDGATVCAAAAFNSDSGGAQCKATKTGKQLILVSPFYEFIYGMRGYTPYYSLSVQRLVHRPTGCRTIGYSNVPTEVAFPQPASAECLRFVGQAGDKIRLTQFATSGEWITPATQLVDPQGESICALLEGDGVRTCTLTQSGIHTVYTGHNGNYSTDLTGTAEITLQLT